MNMQRAAEMQRQDMINASNLRRPFQTSTTSNALPNRKQGSLILVDSGDPHAAVFNKSTFEVDKQMLDQKENSINRGGGESYDMTHSEMARS